jgi:hypothetical protein
MAPQCATNDGFVKRSDAVAPRSESPWMSEFLQSCCLDPVRDRNSREGLKRDQLYSLDCGMCM